MSVNKEIKSLRTSGTQLDCLLCELETAHEEKKAAEDRYATLLFDITDMIECMKQEKISVLEYVEHEVENVTVFANACLSNAKQRLDDLNT